MGLSQVWVGPALGDSSTSVGMTGLGVGMTGSMKKMTKLARYAKSGWKKNPKTYKFIFD